jgi:hypothetical protein
MQLETKTRFRYDYSITAIPERKRLDYSILLGGRNASWFTRLIAWFTMIYVYSRAKPSAKTLNPVSVSKYLRLHAVDHRDLIVEAEIDLLIKAQINNQPTYS